MRFSILIYPVEGQLLSFGFITVQTDSHVVEQHFRSQVGQNVRGYQVQGVFKQSISQFVGAHEKFIAPRAGFRLVAELFQSVRRQISCLGVLRISKNHVL